MIHTITYENGLWRPLFPPEVWNHFEDAKIRAPQTNNAVEGFHNALNSMFHCSKPSMWAFLDGIRRDMGNQAHTIATSEAGTLDAKKKKYLHLSERLQGYVQDYEVTDKMKYLRKVSHLYKN